MRVHIRGGRVFGWVFVPLNFGGLDWSAVIKLYISRRYAVNKTG